MTLQPVLLTCFHHYLFVFAMFINLFLASSHQLYAELWLDFLSFAGLLVTFEMTSRLAGVVLRLWTHQSGHFLLLHLCIQFIISGMYCCCHVLGTLYFLYVASHSALYFDDGLIPLWYINE